MTIFPISGGCLCGRVRYTVNGPAHCVVHCHCSLCRRSHASLVGTGATINRNQVQIDEGKTNLTSFEKPPGIHREFCQTCGCSLFYYVDNLPEILFYYPATLDGGVHPGHAEGSEHHVHVGSKAMWESFEDSLPRHDKGLDQAILINTE